MVGFSIKLAPGVRVRASSRGLRASVGPRAARLHVGGGRTGVSTGMGPVSFYSSIGGGRRRTTTTTSVARYQQQVLAQQHRAEKAAEAQRLVAAFQHILSLHQTPFPPAVRPVASPPALPDRAALYRHYEQHALAGISVFRRAERTKAKQRANAWTNDEVARRQAAAQAQQAQWQQQLDERWQRLCRNDPETVIATLAEAFEDNEAPSAAVGVVKDEAALVVLVPQPDQVIPERMPSVTAAGNLSLKKLTQRERADYYTIFVCGQLLVTVREALAVAPGLAGAGVVALRNDGPDVYGRARLVCLTAARLSRRALDGVQWATAGAVNIINEVASERLINQRGRSAELAPLDLSQQPELAALIEAIDLREFQESVRRTVS